MLRRNPGLTVVAVLTLALGIGANTAIFTIVDAVLLRPLPYPAPQELVKISGRYDKLAIAQNWISEPELWDMRDALRSFSSIAAYSTGGGANFTRDASEPLRVTTNVPFSKSACSIGLGSRLGIGTRTSGSRRSHAGDPSPARCAGRGR